MRRECLEEIGWAPDELKFFATFPNRYEFRGVLYNTCDLFFYARVPALDPGILTLQPAEAAGVRWLAPEDIPGDAIAFGSTREALRVFRRLSRP